METSNFTVVCHGKRRETLTAGALVKLFPALENLEKIPGKPLFLSSDFLNFIMALHAVVEELNSPASSDS